MGKRGPRLVTRKNTNSLEASALYPEMVKEGHENKVNTLTHTTEKKKVDFTPHK